MNCPFCGSKLLFSKDRGAHCDGCDQYEQLEDPPAVAQERQTPRTDALSVEIGQKKAFQQFRPEYVDADFARKFERELAEANELNSALSKALNQYGLHFRQCLGEGKCTCGLDAGITEPNYKAELAEANEDLKRAFKSWADDRVRMKSQAEEIERLKAENGSRTDEPNPSGNTHARLNWWKAQSDVDQEEIGRLRSYLERLRDCDWVISLPDRMDAVRELAREALSTSPGPTKEQKP